MGRTINVLDHGVDGGGKVDNTKAIRSIVKDVLATGDTLLFPGRHHGTPQVYLTGPVAFTKHQTLERLTVEIEEHATLLAHHDKWGSDDTPFVSVDGFEHFELCGDGVIDCHGNTWWQHADTGSSDDSNPGPTSILAISACHGVVKHVKLRRPAHISVQVDGITSPLDGHTWSFTIENVKIEGGWVDTHNVPPRLAGVAVSDSEHVRVTGCRLLDMTDDNLVAKGNCRHLRFEDIDITGHHRAVGAGASLGTEVDGTHDVLFRDISVSTVNDAIHVKPLVNEQATARGVTWQHITVHDVNTAITIEGVDKGTGPASGPIVLDDIAFSDVTGTVAGNGTAYDVVFKTTGVTVTGTFRLEDIDLENGHDPWNGYTKYDNEDADCDLDFDYAGHIRPGRIDTTSAPSDGEA